MGKGRLDIIQCLVLYRQRARFWPRWVLRLSILVAHLLPQYFVSIHLPPPTFLLTHWLDKELTAVARQEREGRERESGRRVRRERMHQQDTKR